MTERRYREEEVRRIFGLATQKAAETSPSSPANGLTLAEMQNIGLEVGLHPDAVARAAALYEERTPQLVRKSMGVPVEVGRTVALERALTDHEWDQLVAELRHTFQAKGKSTMQGGLREWRNGNLHASIEPTESGYRLRMGTVKGDAAGMNALGASGIVASVVTLVSLALSQDLAADPDVLLGPVMFATAGIGVLISNWVRLPRWAQRRAQQMNHIAARIRSIMAVKEDS